MPKNNVVPDHFKVQGRLPQGQDVAHEVEKQQYGQEEKGASPKASLPKPVPGKRVRKAASSRKSG